MPLTASQVHQVQLGLPDVLVTQGVAVDHLQVDGEDGVGPGGVRVHGGGRGHPVGDPLLEQHGHLGYTVHLGREVMMVIISIIGQTYHVHCQALHSVLLPINVRIINYSIISV